MTEWWALIIPYAECRSDIYINEDLTIGTVPENTHLSLEAMKIRWGPYSSRKMMIVQMVPIWGLMYCTYNKGVSSQSCSMYPSLLSTEYCKYSTNLPTSMKYIWNLSIEHLSNNSYHASMSEQSLWAAVVWNDGALTEKDTVAACFVRVGLVCME